MTNYIYFGIGGKVGRFGTLAPGDVVSLTDEEVATVQGNISWAPAPTATGKKFLPLAAGATLTTGQSGLVILSTHAAPVTYTLPNIVQLGCNYEFQFGPGATGDITLARNGRLMDGGTSNLVIAIATEQRKGVYYNGVTWISYAS